MHTHTRALRALANERRLHLLAILWKNREQSVSDLAEGIRLSFKSTSRHLSVLYQADLVLRRQIGLEVLYSINKSHSIWKKTLQLIVK